MTFEEVGHDGRQPHRDESLGLAAVEARLPLDEKSLASRIDELGFSAISRDGALEVRDGDNIAWRLNTA